MWAVSGSRFFGEMCQLVALCARGFPALDQYRDNALINIKKWRPIGEGLGAVARRTCGNQPLYPGGGGARREVATARHRASIFAWLSYRFHCADEAAEMACQAAFPNISARYRVMRIER
ncbi:hypothetical protein [Burkholderia gladioli]|uniref:hypothetical protein n=1 Tax=Burkholderia gladioli TaxID=28095 RepID=UPI001640A6D4|nr:hypothetical protein [Burkholderia gladioli]